MGSERKVSIRLGTSGQADVSRAFEEIAQSGDASAKRLVRSYERAGEEVEAAMRRQAATAAKINAIAPQSAVQMQVAGANGTGFGEYEGSARRSAAAFAELIAQQERLEQRTHSLLASLNPVIGAQQRYDAEMANARDLIQRGAISLDDYCAKLRQQEAALELANRAQARGGVSSGQHASAMQNLSYQAQDFFIQLQAGTPFVTAFAQQGTQATASMTGLGGKVGAFATFMQGPWGLAITGGLILVGALVSKFSKASETVESETKKLEENAKKTKLADDAKRAFGRTEAGIAESIRATTAELDRQNQSLLTNSERMNIRAKQDLEKLQKGRPKLANDLEDARATLTEAKAGGPGTGPATLSYAQAQFDRLKAQLDTLDADIEEGLRNVQRSRVSLASDAAKALIDPVERVRRSYQGQIDDEIRRQDAAARTGRVIGKIEQDRLRGLYEAQKAAVDAEQQKQAAINKTTTARDGETASLANVVRMLRADIPGVAITSGQRTRAEQQRLYNLYLAGKGNIAAEPGTSDHERGQAVDIRKTSGLTRAMIEQSFTSKGMTIKQFIDEGNIFHVAWEKGKFALDNYNASLRLTKDATREAEEQAAELSGLADRFDPATAAATRYAQTLAKIAAFTKAGKLSPAQSDLYQAGAKAELLKVTNPEYFAQEKGFEPLLKADQEREEAVKRRADFVRSTLADQGDQLILADKELSLVGQSDDYRQAQITKLQLILQLKREVIDAESEDGQAILANADALAVYAARQRQAQAAWDEIQQVGGSAIDRLFDPSSAESWGDRVMGVLDDLKNEFIKLALLNPLKNALFGQSNPTFGGVLGKLGGLFGGGGDLSSLLGQGNGNPSPIGLSSLVDPATFGKVGRPNVNYAVGTQWASGGRALVGENGAEIVDMPKGAKVYPSGETRRMLAANDTAPAITIDASIHAPGADSAALARVEAAQRQMAAELPGRVIAIWNDARQRRMIG